MLPRIHVLVHHITLVLNVKQVKLEIKSKFIADVIFLFNNALLDFQLLHACRGETRALIGGGEYSYIRVLPDEFLLKLTLMTADFKRNSSGRTRRYEYSSPPPN